jgi:outer membrane protein
MKTFLVLFLVLACGAVRAQTPANNPMPDGSRDMYVGLGLIAAPDYLGASEKRTSALPLIQAQWSNGLFVAGLSAGMHWSGREDLEFGPLLAIDGGRDQDGPARAGSVNPVMGFQTGREARTGQGLLGMRDVKARLQGGAFLNYYLTPSLRLTNSLLYGAGNGRDGTVWQIGVQQMATEFAPHHRLSLSAGVNLVTRNYNAAFFGVTPEEALASGHPVYQPGGGLRDFYVGAGWNWDLSPSWMVTSAARLARLRGDARHSPLVERPTNFSVSSGLVYRF